MKIRPHEVWADIQAIKKNSPLIHNITNYVVMEHTANSLLAIGASPVMAHALEEVSEITELAHCLILNIGTLSPHWVTAMLRALKTANAKNISVVLDPVGSGATRYRTTTAQSILEQGTLKVVRGNVSEILSLSQSHNQTRGVDSHLNAADFKKSAEVLALSHNCVIWMSGKSDVVTNGRTSVLIHNGDPLMGRVTGMGCTATAVTGAFLAVNSDSLRACAHAAILMGVTGEVAKEKCSGPASFKLAFVDALYTLTLGQIEERLCIEIR